MSWTNVVNAIANGGSLQKNGGCDGCPDAGGVSQQQVQSGTGSMTFTPSVGAASGLALYTGFAHATSTPPQPAEIDFAFSFWATGGWEVRERGVYKTNGTLPGARPSRSPSARAEWSPTRAMAGSSTPASPRPAPIRTASRRR